MRWRGHHGRGVQDGDGGGAVPRRASGVGPGYGRPARWGRPSCLWRHGDADGGEGCRDQRLAGPIPAGGRGVEWGPCRTGLTPGEGIEPGAAAGASAAVVLPVAVGSSVRHVSGREGGFLGGLRFCQHREWRCRRPGSGATPQHGTSSPFAPPVQGCAQAERLHQRRVSRDDPVHRRIRACISSLFVRVRNNGYGRVDTHHRRRSRELDGVPRSYDDRDRGRLARSRRTA